MKWREKWQIAQSSHDASGCIWHADMLLHVSPGFFRQATTNEWNGRGKDEEAARDKSFASNIPQIALLWQASEHTEP